MREILPEYFEGNLSLKHVFKKYPKLNKKHRETCPVCSRTLVNIYRHYDEERGGEWKCLQCWENEARHAVFALGQTGGIK